MRMFIFLDVLKAKAGILVAYLSLLRDKLHEGGTWPVS
jgi:hypothetical protein